MQSLSSYDIFYLELLSEDEEIVYSAPVDTLARLEQIGIIFNEGDIYD